MLDYSHNGFYALASLAIALIAAFSGLTLTQGASGMRAPVRKVVVSVSAVILGWGIWSMHFVAMLGLDLPIAFYFDPLVTLISALTVILLMGLALLIVHFGTRTRGRIILAGGIVGVAIPVMHYIGMSGMELCSPVYSPLGVVVALALSIAFSVAAFLISYRQRTRRDLLLGTLAFGAAVFAVHFIAMAGTGFVADPDPETIVPLMSKGVLAFGVTISAFVLSGAFLLSGATFATRLDRSAPEAAPEPAPVPEPAPSPGLRLPYESDSRTHFIDAEAVSAIRAEGHYTILYAGAERLFCPWSISEADKRIPKPLFLRTHRSYLVNRDHVTSFERRKDNGVCYFENTASLPKAPVSRSRLRDVREALGM
ncbi:MHYT domain-containing protein [Tropicibacter naphthalenivorans]|uniref:CO-responsive transcriptional regulator RcoM n=1 Tax=Tropicibacter naphthalenivorans TaxID=441103 RepID=A0A0P1GDC0_9RHOB|nr:MHYT domain-containing protein [Tropicibacter naphthalenivorans]CUH79469.1 CO-responsive transcriptional regulator RcoM [Tropicibacter naphthalenivorans]SMC72780.1 MHYT domain-containing protein, NO-binding membrane sensor [Tropicibacter naphthalenivorans]